MSLNINWETVVVIAITQIVVSIVSTITTVYTNRHLIEKMDKFQANVKNRLNKKGGWKW